MYTPKFNQIEDRTLLIEAMRSYSFAILFGSGPDDPNGFAGSPVATHLPLVIHDSGPHGVLEGHFARANAHWKSLAGKETLVVFSGPHSYVSPTLYVDPQSVPTWNYIAIHAYGILELIENEAEKDALLKNLIALHEPSYANRWQTLSQKYRSGMLQGIVGFRIPIARIEGKFKLSQNRPEADRRNVFEAHANGTTDQQSLAEWMTRLSET